MDITRDKGCSHRTGGYLKHSGAIVTLLYIEQNKIGLDIPRNEGSDQRTGYVTFWF